MILEVVDDRWGMKVEIDGDGDAGPRGQSLLGFNLSSLAC
jgi:hypothetical protein